MKRLTTTVGVLTTLLFLTTTLWAATTPAQRMFTPDEALNQLKAGNDRFAAGHAHHPNQDRHRRIATTSKGQHPFATVIACSDSRVPVEIIFDQGVGDLFVVKVAGNVMDVDEIGSVEYGVDHLATPVMVVLGHTHCGAVTAVVQDAEVHGSIPQLVDNIVPAVKKTRHDHPELKGDALVTAAVINNVWQSITDLLMHSPATRARIKAGTLEVVGAVYDIDTGKIDWLGTPPNQAKIMAAAGPAAGAHGAEEAKDEQHKMALEKERAQEMEAVANPEYDGAATDHAPAHETAKPKETEHQKMTMEEEHAQEMEAEAVPEHVDGGGSSGLWFIFFLMVAILGAVYMKSKTKK
ncbi:carbonic anhydrase [Desulfoplanes sp.]